jgi:hypothetical protein
MRFDLNAAPTDSQPAPSPSGTHTYAVPVVRELPRPVPPAAGSAW